MDDLLVTCVVIGLADVAIEDEDRNISLDRFFNHAAHNVNRFMSLVTCPESKSRCYKFVNT